jgi:hypothetical protein
LARIKAHGYAAKDCCVVILGAVVVMILCQLNKESFNLYDEYIE